MKNKIFIIFVLGLLLFLKGCKTTLTLVSPVEYENSLRPFQSCTVYAWKADTVSYAKDIAYYEFPPIEEIKNLSEIKKTFYTENGELSDEELNNSDYIIALATPLSTNIIKMRGSVPYHTSISKYGVTDWGEILYDESGNIRKISIGALKTDLFFEKGTGYYINTDFLIRNDTIRYSIENNTKSYDHYNERDLLHRVSFIHLNDTLIKKMTYDAYITEEGQLKNNYKVGEWKYYNKEGNLTHTRQYKKSDKVDVRFPYCIWNKIEPCYCNNN